MKTAVDWLVEQIINRDFFVSYTTLNYLQYEAKGMEKQQVIDAVKSTDYIIGATDKESEEFAQQYYNETFKSE